MVHKLDDLYEKWWRSDGVDKDEHDALMLATLRYARRSTGDDDAASDAVLYIASNFERFYRKTPDSYSHWVSSICRKRRQNRLHRKATERSRYIPLDVYAYNEQDIEAGEEDYTCPDLDRLEPWQQDVANVILAGGTIRDAAEQMGTSTAALKMRLSRNRNRRAH